MPNPYILIMKEPFWEEICVCIIMTIAVALSNDIKMSECLNQYYDLNIFVIS